jgi:hypothetical protein
VSHFRLCKQWQRHFQQKSKSNYDWETMAVILVEILTTNILYLLKCGRADTSKAG